MVAGQCLLAIGAALSLVVVAVLMSELFPTRVRYTASALTYNIIYTVFGGTAPFLATYLVSRTGNALSPAFYLAAVSLLALVSALALPETAGRLLDDEPPGVPTPPAATPRGAA